VIFAEKPVAALLCSRTPLLAICASFELRH